MQFTVEVSACPNLAPIRTLPDHANCRCETEFGEPSGVRSKPTIKWPCAYDSLSKPMPSLM